MQTLKLKMQMAAERLFFPRAEENWIFFVLECNLRLTSETKKKKEKKSLREENLNFKNRAGLILNFYYLYIFIAFYFITFCIFSHNMDAKGIMKVDKPLIKIFDE